MSFRNKNAMPCLKFSHYGFSVMCFCMSAEPEKPGVCPKHSLDVAVSGACVEMCSHDSNCPNDQKCCSNGCGHQCMAPHAGIYVWFFFVCFLNAVSHSPFSDLVSVFV